MVNLCLCANVFLWLLLFSTATQSTSGMQTGITTAAELVETAVKGKTDTAMSGSPVSTYPYMLGRSAYDPAIEPTPHTMHGTKCSDVDSVPFILVFIIGVAVGVTATVSAQAALGNIKSPFQSVKEDEVTTTVTTVVTRSTTSAPLIGSSGSNDEPEMEGESFGNMEFFGPRCLCLCTLLVIQSGSSLVLEFFTPLIANYTELVYYFTMLVGLGGNAGVQSVVLAVRRFAKNEPVSILEQTYMGMCLAIVLAPLATLRCFVQGTSQSVCLVVGVSAALITVLSTAFGTSLTKGFFQWGLDPAHASPTIQVLMDMLGLSLVCLVAYGFIAVGLMPRITGEFVPPLGVQ